MAPLAVGALVLMSAIGVALFWRSSPPAAKPLPPPMAAPLVAPAPPVEKPAAVAKPPEKVKLRIDSEPPAADVFRAADSVLIGTTPLVEELNATNGRAVFLIKHAGFKDARVELPADQDGSTMVKLERAHSEKKTKAPVAEKPAPPKRIRGAAYDPFAQ